MKRVRQYILFISVSLSLLFVSACTQRTALNPGSAPIPNPQLAQPATHVALLLPLHGRYAADAEAIKNGFFATYYYYNARSNNINPLTIKVYDTSNQPIANVYQQALQNGSNFVVGPLTKANVIALQKKTKLTAPTLALNTIDSSAATHNLYQFGLSPLDDALQAALKANQDQHHHVLVIYPATAWGQSIAQTFMTQWQQQGNTVVGTFAYHNQRELAPGIAKLLNVSNSDQDAIQLQQMLKKKIRFVPRRRQDFDSIFLVANNNDGRQIVPILRYYFAGNVPVYSISTIYPGSNNRSQQVDLNGIQFCDIPWILLNDNQLGQVQASLRQQVISAWPKGYRQRAKLYALGVDAYQLIFQLNNLANGGGMSGATGNLTLNGNNQIFRQLVWAKIVKGYPNVTSWSSL